MERFIVVLVAVIGVPLVLAGYIVSSEQIVKRLPRRAQPKVRPWFWVGPALLLVTVFLVYPTIATIVVSLRDRAGDFVALLNYQQSLSDPSVLISIRNNVLWIVLLTGLVLVFGLAFAVLADRVPYESVAKSLIFMPMAISFVAAGVIWRFMFYYRPPGQPQTGTLNAVWTGLTQLPPRTWLIDHSTNNFALIMTAVWVWTGFAMVILSASLKGIPAELLEAARVDGANELTVFGRVILPLLAPTITVVITTMVITALKAFDVVYVMTNGAFDTDVMANRMYKELFNNHNFGRSGAIAVMLLLASIPVLYFNLSRFREQEARR
jgi:alpha-glucoside transport system permease protein